MSDFLCYAGAMLVLGGTQAVVEHAWTKIQLRRKRCDARNSRECNTSRAKETGWG